MGLHAYCIANAQSDDASIGVQGIDGVMVRTIADGALSMWCTEHAAPPSASVEAIRQHNDVVNAAMTDTHSPVPLRFGQWLRDEADAIAALHASREKWTAMAHRFEGAVEFGVRVFDPSREEPSGDAAARQRPRAGDRRNAPDGLESVPAAASDAAPDAAPASAPGRAYMEALAARLRGPEAVRSEVLGALRDAMHGIVLAERAEPLNTPHGVVSVAYLLHRGRSDAFREAVDAVRVAMPRLRLLSTGPWPPYSFVE